VQFARQSQSIAFQSEHRTNAAGGYIKLKIKLDAEPVRLILAAINLRSNYLAQQY